MSDQPVVINLPEPLYEQIQQIAASSNRTVEAVLLESLDILFSQTALAASDLKQLSSFSDEQLWAVVHRRLLWTQSLRLHDLGERQQQSRLDTREQTELDKLLELNDAYMLLRSEALRLLKQRGYDVADYFTPVP